MGPVVSGSLRVGAGDADVLDVEVVGRDGVGVGSEPPADVQAAEANPTITAIVRNRNLTAAIVAGAPRTDQPRRAVCG